MKLLRTLKVTFLLLLIALCVNGSSPPRPTSKFDEFGDISCEDEWARLDNFAIQLQNWPSAKGYIIFYGGRLFRGRLPKQGEAAARAARMKPYLVKRRSIPSNRVIVIDGGYSDAWSAELWIVPPGASPPSPSSFAVLASKIKFGKGKVNKRALRCSNPG
jgi:hypothetical protein